MFILNENEKEYRHGDHGPKYLEEGPEIAFVIMKLLPGQAASGQHSAPLRRIRKR